MASRVLLVYLISKISIAQCSFCDKDHPSNEDAVSFMNHFNHDAEQLCHSNAVADWNLSEDITSQNREILVNATYHQKEFLQKSAVEAESCAWQLLSDPMLRRQFEILDQEYKAKLPTEKAEELRQTSNKLQSTYVTATVCPYNNNESSGDDICNMTLYGMIPVLETSTNAEELLHYWKQWRQATGDKLRDTYRRFIALSNEEAKLNGFSDVGEKWRFHYDIENFAGVLENLLEKVRPLHRQLQTYVRRKLIGVYGEGNIRENGPLPVHLLGYETPSNWMNLEKLVRPYPDKSIIDITPMLEMRNLTEIEMVRMADNFFQSLGLDPMSNEFWNNSAFVKYEDQSTTCRRELFDFCDGKDIRVVLMCIRNTMDDLKIIHRAIGHIQYRMLYAHLPYILREGANDGFDEAAAEAIGLSLFTTSHWKTLGFMDNALDDDAEKEINTLLKMALDRIPVLSFTYVLEKWRWGLFDGSISFDNANQKWWEYILEYLGVCPPLKRTEQSLDAMESFQVAAHISVDRYFVSDILQFQFHKALCDASGYEGPLHKCDIYGSVDAGIRLKNMMSLGRSKPWPEALKTVTGGDTDYLDVQPLLDYFQPLYLWLKEQNENEAIGWVSEDPTVCP